MRSRLPVSAYNGRMNTDLNTRMKKYRKRRGYTQAQMARACGISASFLSALERGVYQPSASTLIAWARACGVSIDELAGFAPESTVDPELERMISAMDKREQKKLAAMIKIAKHK